MWPAWRSNYDPGINLYYYKVPGGEPVPACARSLRGKGVALAAHIALQAHVANCCPTAVVIIVQVLGKYLIIGYLDP